MRKNEIEISFDNLIRLIDNLFRKLNKDKDEAFILKNYDLAQEIIEKEKKLDLLKDKIKNLKNEFSIIFNNYYLKNEFNNTYNNKSETIKSEKEFRYNQKGNFIKGKRTSEEEFYIPILESLIELGGRSQPKNILTRVHEKIKEKLTDYDYLTLPNSKIVRWENTARWARKHLIDLGYLNSNSPTGIWEITEKGIEFYNNQKKEL